MGNIYFRSQYKKIGSQKTGVEIIINTKIVTRELIEYISQNESPRYISFTDRVEIIDENCFYHLNIDRVSFNSATNIQEIRAGAFKKAVRLHCVDCFENVEKLGESAFEGTQSEDALHLPYITRVPEKCFKNAKFLDIILPNAEQIADSAMEGLQLEKSKSV